MDETSLIAELHEDSQGHLFWHDHRTQKGYSLLRGFPSGHGPLFVDICIILHGETERVVYNNENAIFDIPRGSTMMGTKVCIKLYENGKMVCNLHNFDGKAAEYAVMHEIRDYYRRTSNNPKI